MAGRQHNLAGAERGLTFDIELDAVLPVADRDDVAGYHPKATVGALDRLGEQVLQVPAVDCAGNEIGAAIAAVAARQPLHEMVRLVGQGRHVAGTDIEKMMQAVGRVGDAQSQMRATLDEGDAQPAPADELGGKQHAAGAAADDCDVDRRR